MSFLGELIGGFVGDTLSGLITGKKKQPTAVTIAVPYFFTLGQVAEKLAKHWHPHFSGIDQERANSETHDGLVEFTFYPDQAIEHDDIVNWFGSDARIEAIAPYEMKE